MHHSWKIDPPVVIVFWTRKRTAPSCTLRLVIFIDKKRGTRALLVENRTTDDYFGVCLISFNFGEIETVKLENKDVSCFLLFLAYIICRFRKSKRLKILLFGSRSTFVSVNHWQPSFSMCVHFVNIRKHNS